MGEKKHYPTHLGDKGRIGLPAPLRKALGLQEGDRILFQVEQDQAGGAVEVKLVSAREIAESGKGLLVQLYPELADRALTAELLEERRGEAAKE